MLIVIANAVGWLLAYYGLSFWLQQFAYRIDIGADTFLMVGVLSLVVVMAVLSYHVVRTVTANMADVLRSGQSAGSKMRFRTDEARVNEGVGEARVN